MFSDPQTVTVSGSGKTLNKVTNTADGSKFATAARDRFWTITHSYGRRHRHTLRHQFDTLVTNPLVAGQNISQSITIGLWVDVPPGYDTATVKAEMDGLLANLNASTGANLTKLIGGES